MRVADLKVIAKALTSDFGRSERAISELMPLELTRLSAGRANHRFAGASAKALTSDFDHREWSVSG